MEPLLYLDLPWCLQELGGGVRYKKYYDDHNEYGTDVSRIHTHSAGMKAELKQNLEVN